MPNTIAQLFRGQLEPKNLLGNGNTEMRRTGLMIENNYNKLKDKLNKDDKEVFEKYNHLIDEYIALITEQAFCDGFCMSARILSEAVGGAERIL